jgi:DNA mismatch repair protein MutL
MTLPAIQQLPISLVNRIAAGEVIERPASVVKELVENALDAGASHIRVEIEDGGRELVRVIDDGGGIPAEQLPLAFAEHATSKIRNDDDLFHITTMGFRGEALASIGAVAQVRLVSRVAGSEAHELDNQGGQISAVRAASGNVGTTIEVRNLFFNTPARRKFLKGTSTELGHISEMMLRLALPYPQVVFTLKHGPKTLLDLPAQSAAERLLAAWPEEFHRQRLDIDACDGELRLSGIIGTPELARPTGKYQYVFLNGRFIRDRFIQHAAREAYRGLTEPGRQPAVVLLLNLPPQDVDVNVHPTKIEVRFKDSGRIHALVFSGLREKLNSSELTPSATAQSLSQADPQRQGMREKLAAFFRQLPPDALGDSGPAPAAPPLDWGRPLAPAPHPTFAPAAASPLPSMPVASAPLTPPSDGPQRTFSPNSRPPAIQLHNTYLVAESDEGMIIIDQHALHERVMYEELRARLGRGPLESQRLLIPPSLTATPRQMALLEQITPLLQRLGIEIAPFGPDSVAIQAFPSFLSRLDPEAFVRELLERGEQELLDLHEEELLHELLDMMACKAAVKAGDPLSPAEIEALLQRRDLVDRSSNCPHGRPTTLRLTLGDLEKQFKRTGF